MAIALALLVSADPVTIQQCSRALQEFSILPDVCQEAAGALHLLNRRKFDAVIVDLQLGEQAGLILDEVHLSPSNRTAVTFAISGSDAEATTFRERSEFVLERPLSAKSIEGTLRPAYGLILRERRRYFRCPVSIPVVILRRTKHGNRAGVHGCQRDRRSSQAEQQRSKRMLSRNSGEISRCPPRWAMCVRDRPSHGADRSKLWCPRPIRHRRVRWYGLFHYRSVDCAVCPHCVDHGVKDTHMSGWKCELQNKAGSSAFGDSGCQNIGSAKLFVH